MVSPTQDDRIIAIDTPLGKDALLLTSFSGVETLSEHFLYTADVELVDSRADLMSLLGKPVTVSLELFDGSHRYFSARVIEISRASVDAASRLILRPWLYMLEHSVDCRVYRELSVVDIIDQVLSRHGGVADYEMRLTKAFPSLDFSVQYNESDSRFIHRLMERFGLYYFYEHESSIGKHKLVVCDHDSAHSTLRGYEKIPFDPDVNNAQRDTEIVTDWYSDRMFESSLFTTRDYNYERSHTDLSATCDMSSVHSDAIDSHEVFYYPGGFQDNEQADSRASIMGEASHAQSNGINATTTARGLACGNLFALIKHDDRAQNADYLITSANVSVSSGQFRSGGGQSVFSCSFSAIKKSIPFRKTVTTARPVIAGVQTAIVVGPSGEEIHTNEHGCVKLKFHWDRSDYTEDQSSGWVRVGFLHAGKGFGGYNIPRVGEEVAVQFVEGDPDRPIVVGRLYNDFTSIPLNLPAEKSQSGIKTNSTKGGGGFNQLTMDDKKGEESFHVQAEKDMSLLVKNDSSRTIENDESAVVEGNQSVEVKGKQEINVTGTRDVVIDSAASCKIASTYDVEANGAITVKSPSQIALEVGGSKIVLTPASIDIKTSGIVTINGSLVKIN